MPLLQPMSSTGARAAGCGDGMGCKARCRGGEGIWKAKLMEKASERQSHLSLEFALSVWVSPRVV